MCDRSKRLGGKARLIGGLVACVLLTASVSEAAVNPQVRALEQAFVETGKQIIPSVVTISTTQTVVAPQAPFDLREFFGDDLFRRFEAPEQEHKRQGLGSGIIVDAQGYILTNNHVIKDAEEIEVILPDKRAFEAKVVGTDPLTDVAVIRIEGENLPVARLGSSESVQIGQIVFAVGNPLNLSSTMTQGIVSALGRSIQIIQDSFGIESFIQTDAAINQGNSGGALVNLDGEVIGVNVAIATQTGYYMGYGFAIPIDLAKKVMRDFIEKGRVVRAYLGVSLQVVNEDMAKSLKMDVPKGVAVAGLLEDGPAKDAGVKVGDVILAVDGTEVSKPNQVQIFVAQKRPGDGVKLDILRKGKQQVIAVKLGEREAGATAAGTSGKAGSEALDIGVSVRSLTGELAEKLELSQDDKGVVVVGVKGDSPADKAGIRAGDLIMEIDEAQITSIEGFQEVVGKLKPGDAALFVVKRQRNTLLAPVRLPKRE